MGGIAGTEVIFKNIPSNNLYKKKILYNQDGSIKGIATGDMGIGKDGKPKVMKIYLFIFLNVNEIK